MLGAIVGDIIGSKYESKNIVDSNFPLFSKDSDFTDDTVLTCATAEKILFGTSYEEVYRKYAKMYKNRGYGSGFANWVNSSNPCPYNSYGNGSAMRVSPIGWSFNSYEEVEEESEKSASVTHNHPEGINGAKAVALAIYMARNKESKQNIVSTITEKYCYNKIESINDIVRKFDVSCQGTVPICLTVLRDTNSFEEAIRTVISIGGDTDTNAAIVGSIAEVIYDGVPLDIASKAISKLSLVLKYIVKSFYEKYNCEKYGLYFS